MVFFFLLNLIFFFLNSSVVCDTKLIFMCRLQTLTGFAFNVPHVVAPFHFYVLIGRWHFIVIAFYINEILEEFILAISGRWGFTLDPAYDLESRYDSLIRDSFCCVSGLLLAILFVK